MSKYQKTANKDLNRKSIEDFKHAQKNPVIMVLDNVRSLNNIGSVFRTSDGFLIESLYLCGICGTPPHKDIHKTALGAEDSLSWQYFENTLDAIKTLKKSGYKVYALEQAANSTLLENFLPQKKEKYAFVFGHEVKGVSQDVIDNCTGVIEIPQFGTKHSFNITISAGMVLWDYYLKTR